MRIMVSVSAWNPGSKPGDYSAGPHTISEPVTATAIAEAQDWADRTIRSLAQRAAYAEPVEDGELGGEA